MLNFGILCIHVISFFATVLLPFLTKNGGNPIKVGPAILFRLFLHTLFLRLCFQRLSGKIWGNPIKSRAPPVSNTAGIKMSGPGIGIPTGLCFPYNFNQRIRKSKNGERYIWIRQLCKYRRKRKLLRLTSVMRIKSSSGSPSFAHTEIFQGSTVLSANEQSPQDSKVNSYQTWHHVLFDLQTFFSIL